MSNPFFFLVLASIPIILTIVYTLGFINGQAAGIERSLNLIDETESNARRKGYFKK